MAWNLLSFNTYDQKSVGILKCLVQMAHDGAQNGSHYPKFDLWERRLEDDDGGNVSMCWCWASEALNIHGGPKWKIEYQRKWNSGRQQANTKPIDRYNMTYHLVPFKDSNCEWRQPHPLKCGELLKSALVCRDRLSLVTGTSLSGSKDRISSSVPSNQPPLCLLRTRKACFL